MRQLSFIFLSLVVVFFFLAGFYLYYVPSNKETLNKYGFLILQQLQSDLDYKVNADIHLYSNNLQKTFSGDTTGKHVLNARLSSLGVDSMGRRQDRDQPAAGHRTKAPTGDVEGELADIDADRMHYVFHRGADSIFLTIPVSRLLGEVLQTHPNDFFQSFLFVKLGEHTASTVYHTADLALGTSIPIDSLLPQSTNGFYPGITDLRTGDKLFYMPLVIGHRQYVLCGLKSAKEYNEAVREIPPAFIYPIVITLLLLLIGLPLIKVYIMGPGEKVKIWDIVGYSFSLFTGSALVTIIIIQVILLKDGDIRQQQGLESLTRQINRSWNRELTTAYAQLQQLDTLAAGGGANVSRRLIQYMGTSIDAPQARRSNRYYNFDEVNWVNDSGRMVADATFSGQDPLLISVHQRKYFKDMQAGRYYRLPGIDTARITVQPVLRWTDGAFRIILARRSSYQPAYMVTLSTDPYSVNHTVLPSGFGFCIIDATGKVQVHSDSSHNLNENFLDQVDDAARLKSAIAGRQELYLNETKFYGREYGLLMRPLSQLPFYLVTFYDKGYILPVNMRILIFSLLGYAVSFVICGLLWMILFWRRWNARPLLFTPMDFLQWLIPRPRQTRSYRTGCIFLGAYITGVLLLTLLTNFYAPQNNHFILLLLVLTPLLLVLGLGIIWRMNGGANAGIGDRAVIGAAGNATSTATGAAPGKHYLGFYALLIELLVIGLCVLPASLFTWYAHNQEILQSVKKEQLLLAGNLEDRTAAVRQQVDRLGPVTPPWLMDTLLYDRGIYRLQDERISITPGELLPSRADSGFERFYFEVANQFSNDYYDPEDLPVLEDHSTDRQWQWTKPDTGCMTMYYRLPPDAAGGTTARNDRSAAALAGRAASTPVQLLNIRSVIPQRYIYLDNAWKGLFVLVLIALLLVGLYKLVRRVAEGIFLKKFVTWPEAKTIEPPLALAYCDSVKVTGDARDQLLQTLKEKAVFDYIPGTSETEMNEEELKTLTRIRNFKDYYAFVLASCTPKEKYLLYNFSCNGFLNYKNVEEIYRLLEAGILVVKDQEIRLFSRGFRGYILQYLAEVSPEVLQKPWAHRSAWESFRLPFMLLLFVAASFLFFTRQEAWQRVSALIAALSTSLPLVLGLLKSMGKKDAG